MNDNTNNFIISNTIPVESKDTNCIFRAAEAMNIQTFNQSIVVNILKSFGTNESTGNIVLVIEDDKLAHAERLNFISAQNRYAYVFMQQNNNSILLDCYYHNSRIPLCLSGAIGAGYIYFTENPDIFKVPVITTMHQQKMFLEKHMDGIFLNVMPEVVENKGVDDELIEKLLNINLAHVITKPVIASIGSPKILIEVDTIDTLNHLQPNLELIVKWSNENKINGCYVYCRIKDKNFQGRNFNHLNPALEDSATGLAAGALAAHFKMDINLFQGSRLNNPCVIHTKYLGNNILVGGNITIF